MDTPGRQGDVIYVPIERIPDVALEIVERDARGRIVLAEGETTGHAHAILDPAATLFRQADLDEMADRYLRVEAEAVSLVHEEHGDHQLPRGDYVVRIKRQYTPARVVRVYD